MSICILHALSMVMCMVMMLDKLSQVTPLAVSVVMRQHTRFQLALTMIHFYVCMTRYQSTQTHQVVARMIVVKRLTAIVQMMFNRLVL